VDKKRLRVNLEILRDVAARTGCKILLAQKAFSMYALYPFIGEYLAGTAASGLYEARLGKEEMGKENHVFSPAYKESEFAEIAGLCDHIVFNSGSQLGRFAPVAREMGKSAGLRVNPECSTQGGGIYDPCSPCSRLGVTPGEFSKLDPGLISLVEGFHFHTLCEQNADALIETLCAFEEKFGAFLPGLRWLNLGGGHHITRADYDLDGLLGCLGGLKKRYPDIDIYLEPGEAVALNAGYLVTTVVDVVKNGMDIAILDASAACHMPDVLEMPYRPPLRGTGDPGEKKPYTFRLGGPSCLAGDIVGDYAFDRPLKPGDRLVFEDMAIYTMVKTNTFNGMALPGIALMEEDGDCRMIKSFSYNDFKSRLS
jgi:carboxynorspermidine decarboxylase